MTKDNINILILGSGTTSISSLRGSPGYFIKINGTNILLESGCGTLYRLARAGYSIFDLDVVCYSHSHPDHIADLLPLLHSLKWDPLRPANTKQIQLLGPKSVIDYYDCLNRFFGESISPKKEFFSINTSIMQNDKKTVNGICFTTKKVPHTNDSIAYKIEYDGISIVYSGDTDMNKSLISLSKNCDVLIIECSFPSTKKVYGHLVPSEVKFIVKEANPGKVILTHIYPNWTSNEMLEIIELTKSDRYILGQDYLQINISKDSKIRINKIK
ncbi:MAG: ribonuclease Z [Actinobacteria bacterium]|nr:ribonuclease Z [Actinomycetota bacterium]